MAWLVAGLLVVLGVHLVPAIPALRAGLIERLGRGPYIAAFAIASTAGFALLVWGYAEAPRGEQLFGPWMWAKHLARAAVPVAFVLVAASMLQSHLRRWLRQPGYLGVAAWALAHLAANGQARGTLLFAAILAYALAGYARAVALGAGRDVVPRASQDAIAVVAGLAAALLFMGTHWRWIGVPVVSWSF